MPSAITGPATSFRGFSTGLDSSAIISALIDVRRSRQNRLSFDRTKAQKQQTAYGALRTQLSALRTKSDEINSAEKLGVNTASSSDETKVKATASGGAAEGAYSVIVTRLATTQSNASVGYADKNLTEVGSGRIRFTVGGVDHDVGIDAGATLESLRDAINRSAAPVTAAIIEDGVGAKPFRLVLTAKNSGAAGAFSINMSEFVQGEEPLSFSSLSGGLNAQFSVNGLNVERATNTVSDVLEGVTLELKAAGTSAVTIARDLGATKQKIKDFIAAYNDVADGVRAHQNYAERDGKSVLYGDANPGRILDRLKRTALDKVEGLTTQYDTIASLGIRTEANGRLKIDDAELTKALEADFKGVISFFTKVGSGSGAGLARSVSTAVTESIIGVISQRTAALGAKQVRLGRDIEAAEQRLEKYAEGLRNRYAALERIAGQYQAQGASLSAVFG